tara:strand:+ start:329 stop:592 length:264 start_codon:yes stop_codon:yes gene_type:complete
VIRDTSIAAYTALLESGELNRKEQLVMIALKQMGGKGTNTNIAKYLSWPINRVTGRVRSLFVKKVLEAHKRVKNPETGKLNWQWKIV